MDTNKRFLVGSRAFFSGLDGFTPKDYDYLTFVEKGNGFEKYCQYTDGRCCYFVWVARPKDDLIQVALTSGPAMQVGKFLVPEVAEALGLTIQDLEKLQPLIDSLEPKHAYERVIYEAYLANDAFTLTEEQRSLAFAAYKAARPSATKKA